MAKGDICKVEGCTKIVTIDRSLICVMHRIRKVRHNSYELPRIIRTPIDEKRKCKIDNCNNVAKKGQKSCSTHSQRWTKYRSYDLPEKQKLPDGIVKICSIHGMLTEEKASIRIRIKKGRNNVGTVTTCRRCQNDVSKKWKNKNPEKVKLYTSKVPKNRHLKKCYGITPEQYQEMFDKQKGLCRICNKPETVKDRRQKAIRNLAVDHCHESEAKGIMKIRGLLCNRCNSMLGLCRDSIATLLSAVDYLLRHK